MIVRKADFYAVYYNSQFKTLSDVASPDLRHAFLVYFLTKRAQTRGKDWTTRDGGAGRGKLSLFL
jgi:hypothetical protein